MPNPPQIDGFPLWAQITITVLFGLGSLALAFKGYFKRGGVPETPPGTAQLMSATIADMGAIRHLSDVCTTLNANIVGLEAAVREQTHWQRNEHDLSREMCARLRELRETLERSHG